MLPQVFKSKNRLWILIFKYSILKILIIKNAILTFIFQNYFWVINQTSLEYPAKPKLKKPKVSKELKITRY